MEIWDPHFHIWDISKNTKSGHDASQLFAPSDETIYSCREYENDIIQAGSSFSHTGGVFVEVASVCHTKLSGAPFAKACLAETNWVSSQLEQSQKQYVMVSSAPLEDPEIGSILSKLAENLKVCGIRQIINYDPSWPRNGRLGNLLANHSWENGFGKLQNFSFSFDLQLNPHQYKIAASLIEKFPETTVIIDHLGTPKLEDLIERSEQYWQGMAALASCENVFIKISMLSYIYKDWEKNNIVIDTVYRIIETFGINRCFFASNFPVDIKDGWPAERLYSAFLKLVDKKYLSSELKKLFSENAKRAYRSQSDPIIF